MICLYFISTTTIYQHFCTYLVELYLYLYLSPLISKQQQGLPKKVKFCLPIQGPRPYKCFDNSQGPLHTEPCLIVI